MSLRFTELAQVVQPLSERLVGAHVQKAWSPLPRLAYLELRVRMAEGFTKVLLVLSGEPGLERIAVASQRLSPGGDPTPFQRALRHELTSARLLRVTLAEDDRRVHLAFAREGLERELVAELRSPGGNLMLLAQGRILAVSAPEEARDGLRVGREYVPSPGVLGERARQLPSRLEPGEGPLAFAEAAERLLVQREREGRAERIRRRLAAPLQARRARLQRTLVKVGEEAGRHGRAQEERRHGELLRQNLHRLTRGQRRAVLTEYTEEGPREVEVPLDPALGPAAQAERHFQRYRRLTRGCEVAGQRLEVLGAELARVEEELAALQARDEQALLEQVELLAPAAGRPERAVGLPYKEYLSVRGARIWVGRDARGNDALTFKHARPGDLWLHARGVPGSHVVVPLPKGASPEQEVLLDAAHLALHHSQSKGEPRGEVSHTQVKFVRKVKGGAPGQVLHTREKSLLVRMEPERLSRILGSQR